MIAATKLHLANVAQHPNGRRKPLAMGAFAALLMVLPPAQAQRLDQGDFQPLARSGGNSLESVVALVNDDVVLESEVQEMLGSAVANLRARGTPLPPNDILREQVLDQLVINRIQLQRAERSGIKIDDSQLNEAMRNLAEKNNMSLSEFADSLGRQGMDYRQLRERIREDLAIKQLQRRELERRINISEREVDDFIASMTIQGRDLREYRLRHILIAAGENASPADREQARAKAQRLLERIKAGENFAQLAVANSDGQNALEGGDLGWRKTSDIPSLFATTVSRLNKGDYSDVIGSPTGYHIVQVDDLRDSSPFNVQENKVRHILIKTTKVRTNEEARARLRDIRKEVKAGGDFAALAKQYSDDAGSAINGGELGWVPPGQFVPEFEEVVNQLKTGEMSIPFRSRYGWHLVEVQDRRRRDGTDKARRQQARRIIAQRKSQEELQLWLSRLRDEAFVEIIGSK